MDVSESSLLSICIASPWNHPWYKDKNKKPHIQIICGLFYNFFLLNFTLHRSQGRMDIHHHQQFLQCVRMVHPLAFHLT